MIIYTYYLTFSLEEIINEENKLAPVSDERPDHNNYFTQEH